MGVKIEQERAVTIAVEGHYLHGSLHIPKQAKGLIIFAHGSGSSHTSPRNQWIAKFFQDEGLATLLFDLLTLHEEKQDSITRELRFNIPFLATRLLAATDWAVKQPGLENLPIAFFGASTGAAAAIVAAADRPGLVKAVVSRGGRPDLAGQSLLRLKAPILLVVGGADYGVVELNEKAFSMIGSLKQLQIVPDATHLFEEPGALEEVGRMATRWFNQFV
jgi:putative phosphoribosyl transferase